MENSAEMYVMLGPHRDFQVSKCSTESALAGVVIGQYWLNFLRSWALGTSLHKLHKDRYILRQTH